ncbi:MAG TPA: helix-turn-helix transcriptional regulator [Solirubrobacterales bacterium]|nr:helix-turn-helix transcriptional regulator [Solirubrobacterales bacterium]
MKSIHDPRYVEMLGRLRRAREAQGIGQKELATRVGRPQSYISKIETGDRRVDLIEVLDICRVLDIELEAVVPGDLRSALAEGPYGN